MPLQHRILIIDDEVAILAALTRLFRNEFKFVPASSPRQALSILRDGQPFAAVIADYRMPEMTGAQLLGAISLEWPEVRRLLLTGCTDSSALSDAVNVGHVNRILLKPCDPELFRETLRSELAAYDTARVARVESGAAVGCVTALTALLQRSDANAHRRGLRTAQLANSICQRFGRDSGWVLDAAAMLSELGSVGAAPPSSVAGETPALHQPPARLTQRRESLEAALAVIANVPELEAVARLFAVVLTNEREVGEQDLELRLQRRVLEAALDCVDLLERGLMTEIAVRELRRSTDRYSRPVLAALEAALREEDTETFSIVPILRLQIGSVLDEEVRDRITGVLIAAVGHELTEASIDRIRSHLELGRLQSSSCKVRKKRPGPGNEQDSLAE